MRALDGIADDDSCGLSWSAVVCDAASGIVLDAVGPDRVLPTASVGKILLLLTVAARIETGTLDATTSVHRGAVTVADSGLWQHLDADELTIADACRLVGAVSDNLATNVLLDLVGLDAVAATARALGLTDTALLDRVRDVRTPDDPPTLSRGTARELAMLAATLHRGDAVSARASETVRDWLRLNTDLSMVAGAFGLDPLAHTGADRGLRVWNKTGTDDGVRADVGVVETPRGALAFAVLAHWDGADAARDRVLTAMRRVGDALRAEDQFVRP